MNSAYIKTYPSDQRGVSLIELLVGMLVGMLALILISQTLLTAEGQKRTTTGGSDAQINAALSLYTVQRDVQSAGYGFTSSPAIVGCPIAARFNNAAPTQLPANLVPLVITPEAARPAGSVGDAIRVIASSKAEYTIPTRVIPPGHLVGGVDFPVRASLGFAQGDLALVASGAGAPCWMFQVNGVVGPQVVPRVDNAVGWNPPNAPDVAYGDGSVLVNLGALVDNIYAININPPAANSRVLQISSFNAASPANRDVRDVQSEIVNMRAFYGRDTTLPAADGAVDVYDTVTPTTNDGWLRVRSVRVIVVARSATWEKEQVTPANPEWSLGAVPAVTGSVACASGAGSCITIDVGADAAGDVDAKHYRYKIFDTVIPLRNMMWRSS